MNDDELRARFDDAIDDALSADERRAFEAALATRPALRAEYERHREVLEATRALGNAPAPVDLLGEVQRKLRARSGGRFYRDRFAEQRGRRGGMGVMLLLSALVVLLVLAWFAYASGLFTEGGGPRRTRRIESASSAAMVSAWPSARTYSARRASVRGSSSCTASSPHDAA